MAVLENTRKMCSRVTVAYLTKNKTIYSGKIYSGNF